jgi:regulator of nucleoside diphosphate kinase
VSKPKMIVSSTDVERLDKLLEPLPQDALPGRADPRAELDRAPIVDPHDLPAPVVPMNATVRLRVLEFGEAFSMTLVYPRGTDAGEGTASILAPLGRTLPGLSDGHEIEWVRPGGGEMHGPIEQAQSRPECCRADHR